jgi:hypothetical protein
MSPVADDSDALLMMAPPLHACRNCESRVSTAMEWDLCVHVCIDRRRCHRSHEYSLAKT